MPAEDLTQKNEYCSQVPSLVLAFVDTFVDYVVGGQFLHPQPKDHLKTDTQAGHSLPSDGKEKKEDEPLTRPLTRIPAPYRLIAMGDVHGDLNKTKEALQIAGVMDQKDRWIGGESVVVQVGDLLDRGGDEIKIIYLFEKLKIEAQRHGGDVHIMNGNHEIVNTHGDFRYVTPAAMDEFKHWADWYKMGNVLKERCQGLEKPYDFFKDIPKQMSDGSKARMAALRPGGPISSRFLAPHPVVLVVGGTVLVHGGLLPSHIDYGLEEMNNDTREWMQGKTRSWTGPRFLQGPSSLVWLRLYSNEKENDCDCGSLERVLGAVPGAKRMVMGHTIQGTLGINAVCSKKAVRVDVGMSQGCINGAPEVLEILNDQVMTALSSLSAYGLINADDISAQVKRRQVPGLSSLVLPPVKLEGLKHILSPEKFKECVVPPAGSQSLEHNGHTHHKGIIAGTLKKIAQLLGVSTPSSSSAPLIKRRAI